MKNSRLPLLLALAGLPLVLTACPRPYTPPVYLSFSLPDDAVEQNLMLAALSFQLKDDKTLELVPFTLGYGYGKTSSMVLDKAALAALAKNPKCTLPFKEHYTTNMKNITVSPETVKVCNLYFVAYQDLDKNGKPTSNEVRYSTHDLYSFASEAFQYSMTSTRVNSTTTGQRTQGWSLVRHTVLQPSSTPGKYVVTMNSVPGDDQAIAIRLHEDTDFLTSMSLPASGGQK